MILQPALETVTTADGGKLKIWSHGYPFRTVRWHYHPEYEIHLVTATTGRMFVGDHVGPFAPGNLVMTGPDLPHNWLSDVAPGTEVPERCIVLQFGARFLESCMGAFGSPGFSELVASAGRGIVFSAAASDAAAPLLRAMLAGDTLSHPALFLRIVECLIRDAGRRPLASVGYRPQPSVYGSEPLNHVLDHVKANLRHDLCQAELASLSGYTTGGFSRAFRRRTGMTFTAYVTAMRVNHACALLANSALPVTGICFESGFNNVSNFNRQFRGVTAMTPRQYRQRFLENDRLHRRPDTVPPRPARSVPAARFPASLPA